MERWLGLLGGIVVCLSWLDLVWGALGGIWGIRRMVGIPLRWLLRVGIGLRRVWLLGLLRVAACVRLLLRRIGLLGRLAGRVCRVRWAPLGVLGILLIVGWLRGVAMHCKG